MVHVRRQIYCTSPMDCLGIYHTWLDLSSDQNPSCFPFSGGVNGGSRKGFLVHQMSSDHLGPSWLLAVLEGSIDPKLKKRAKRWNIVTPSHRVFFKKICPRKPAVRPWKFVAHRPAISWGKRGMAGGWTVPFNSHDGRRQNPPEAPFFPCFLAPSRPYHQPLVVLENAPQDNPLCFCWRL